MKNNSLHLGYRLLVVVICMTSLPLEAYGSHFVRDEGKDGIQVGYIVTPLCDSASYYGVDRNDAITGFLNQNECKNSSSDNVEDTNPQEINNEVARDQVDEKLRLLEELLVELRARQAVEKAATPSLYLIPTATENTNTPSATGVDDRDVGNTSTVNECSGTWSRTLYEGTSGTDVKQLQTILKELGYFTYPTITGYYGPSTEEAVRTFQRKAGVVASGDPESTGYGVFGRLTRAALLDVCSS